MTDLQIASKAKKKHIQTIIENLNVNLDDVDLYGRYKAKIPLSYISKKKIENNNLILVTATLQVSVTRCRDLAAPTLAVDAASVVREAEP